MRARLLLVPQEAHRMAQQAQAIDSHIQQVQLGSNGSFDPNAGGDNGGASMEVPRQDSGGFQPSTGAPHPPAARIQKTATPNGV